MAILAYDAPGSKPAARSQRLAALRGASRRETKSAPKVGFEHGSR
jgi:hypothetical protein